jgi:hypothetical protein
VSGRTTARALACAVVVGSSFATSAAPPDPTLAPPSATAGVAAEGNAPDEVAADGARTDAAPAKGDSTAELRERVAAREREISTLRGELERLKAKAAAEAAPQVAPAAASTSPSSLTARSSAATSAPPLPAAPGPLLPTPHAWRFPPSWQIEVATATTALVVGFAIGWRTLDRRIRRKYGGLKIY